MKARAFACLFLLVIFIFPSWVQAATYKFYFSSGAGGNPVGNDSSGDGSQSNPWKSLSKAQQKINSYNSTDIVYLYFDRGDSWTWDSSAVKKTLAKFYIKSTNPVVHIDAYGSGGRPIFDGLVNDFSSVPSHNVTTGPFSWNRFFDIDKTNCSISNIEIKRVYGHGIFLKEAHNFTLSHCYIHDFGVSAIVPIGGNIALHGCTAAFNTIHTGQQLYRYDKKNGWGGGLVFTTPSQYSASYDNHVHHNVIYDIYGECITSNSGIMEYNVVGDCGSVALNIPAHGYDFPEAVVRYNYVVYSNHAKSAYIRHDNGMKACVRVHDEAQGGNNNSGLIEIYGNVFVNYPTGIQMVCSEESLSGGLMDQCDAQAAIGNVKIHHNLIIDPQLSGIRTNTSKPPYTIANNLELHDNSIVFFDRSGTDSDFVRDNDLLPVDGWSVYNNHYWSLGESPIVPTEWKKNYNTQDPLLRGESTVSWTSLTGPSYYLSINPKEDLNPPTSSPIYNLSPLLTMDINTLAAGALSDGGGSSLPEETVDPPTAFQVLAN